MDADLRLGDCLEILPSLPDDCIDLLLVDLPYGTTACKWDSIIQRKRGDGIHRTTTIHHDSCGI